MANENDPVFGFDNQIEPPDYLRKKLGSKDELAAQQQYAYERAQETIEREQFYRNYFGNEFMSSGFQSMGPQFLKLLDAEVKNNPQLQAQLQSTSGIYKPFDNGLETRLQGLTIPRVGAQAPVSGGTVSGGVTVPFFQGRDMTYRRMPAIYDVGYQTGLFGGDLNLRAGVAPKEGLMPETMYNIMARYTKKF